MIIAPPPASAVTSATHLTALPCQTSLSPPIGTHRGCQLPAGHLFLLQPAASACPPVLYGFADTLAASLWAQGLSQPYRNIMLSRDDVTAATQVSSRDLVNRFCVMQFCTPLPPTRWVGGAQTCFFTRPTTQKGVFGGLGEYKGGFGSLCVEWGGHFWGGFAKV